MHYLRKVICCCNEDFRIRIEVIREPAAGDEKNTNSFGIEIPGRKKEVPGSDKIGLPGNYSFQQLKVCEQAIYFTSPSGWFLFN
jgi:hypothetical protein